MNPLSMGNAQSGLRQSDLYQLLHVQPCHLYYGNTGVGTAFSPPQSLLSSPHLPYPIQFTDVVKPGASVGSAQTSLTCLFGT